MSSREEVNQRIADVYNRVIDTDQNGLINADDVIPALQMISDSSVFKEADIGDLVSTSATVEIDFEGKDQIDATLSNATSVAITIAGVDIGQEVLLSLTKTAGATITFADTFIGSGDEVTSSTYQLLRVTRVNAGDIFVDQITNREPLIKDFANESANDPIGTIYY